MPGTPRKSLADRVKDNEVKEDNSVPLVVETDKNKVEGNPPVDPPVDDDDDAATDEDFKSETSSADSVPSLDSVYDDGVFDSANLQRDRELRLDAALRMQDAQRNLPKLDEFGAARKVDSDNDVHDGIQGRINKFNPVNSGESVFAGGAYVEEDVEKGLTRSNFVGHPSEQAVVFTDEGMKKHYAQPLYEVEKKLAAEAEKNQHDEVESK